jgi:DNA-binding beta-propeller fold protein YncE
VNREGSALSVINIDQNTVVHEIPTGAKPDGLLLSEDGRFAYVTAEVGDLVYLVDAVGGYVVQSAQVGTRPRRFAATPNGKELWVSAELSGEVHVIDRTTFAVAGKVEFLPPGVLKTDVTPADTLIAKDGRTAYVALGYAAHVAVVDVPARQVAGYIRTDGRTSRLAPTRDQRTLYAAGSSDAFMTIIDVKSRKVTALIEVGRGSCCVLIDD